MKCVSFGAALFPSAVLAYLSQSLSVSLSGVPALLASPPRSCCSFSVLSVSLPNLPLPLLSPAPPGLIARLFPHLTLQAFLCLLPFHIASIPLTAAAAAFPRSFFSSTPCLRSHSASRRDFRCQCAAPHAPTALD